MNYASRDILAHGHVITSIQQMTVPDSVYFAWGTEEVDGVDVSALGLEENELEILLDFAKWGKWATYERDIRRMASTTMQELPVDISI